MKNTFNVIVDNSKVPAHELFVRLVGSEECEPGHSFGPSIRDYYLLHYCVSGKGVFCRHDGEYKVSAGEFFVIRPGEVTVYTADKNDPWSYVWIGFDGAVAERINELPPVVKYDADTFFRIEEYAIRGTTSPEIYLSHLYELFYNLFSSAQTSSDVTKQVKDYIRFHYMEEISVEKIAENAGLNRRYLSRIFKQKYGVAIKEYIVRVRCEKAAGFLRDGYTVSEAAFMSGYPDAFAFSKMFRKVMGVSPSEVRRKDGN